MCKAAGTSDLIYKFECEGFGELHLCPSSKRAIFLALSRHAPGHPNAVVTIRS